jgi:hypothetical protein
MFYFLYHKLAILTVLRYTVAMETAILQEIQQVNIYFSSYF